VASSKSWEREQLRSFVCEYFTVHEVLSQTAQIASQRSEWRLSTDSDHQIISGLTGCSAELIGLVNDISDLAEGNCVSETSDNTRRLSETCSFQDSQHSSIQKDLERRLHHLKQSVPVWEQLSTAADHGPPRSEMFRTIAETKRLAALIYYYSRVRLFTPYDAPIERATTHILRLLPKLPPSETALLWPLFIAGSLGVRWDRDQDRKVVLERLNVLQHKRQLGNVRKVRQIIEEVWKQRDLLGKAFDHRHWKEIVSRHGPGISLA